MEDDENPFEEMDDDKSIDVRDTEIQILKGLLKNQKIYIDFDSTAEILHEKNYFGIKLPNNKLELEIVEGLLLRERNRIEIFDTNGQELNVDQILADAVLEDSNVWIKYLVYRDLRQRGYIARLGYGQDIHYRVFPRGANPKTDIAKYFIYILEEENAVYLDVLDTITTQTINSRKNLLLATVDRLGDITYYQLEQFSLPLNKKSGKKW